jgi:hypothetical protein
LLSIRELLVQFMSSDDYDIMEGRVNGIKNALRWLIAEI